MNFQDVIISLQKYWASKNCVLVQPYDLEVGAGTFHPATLLKVLGPEPWNVAYVQPSRRPTDGRYGENPNRLQQHYQFQVVLKPSPMDVQKQYLNSLKVLGIDHLEHDIRFVEDDWKLLLTTKVPLLHNDPLINIKELNYLRIEYNQDVLLLKAFFSS